jgi:hypothetical protein
VTDKLTDEQVREKMAFYNASFNRVLMSYFPAVSGRDQPLTLEEGRREEIAERLAAGKAVPL